MSTVTPMVEYLLALRRPGGGQLVRYGAIQVTVPIFPAGMEITFTLNPYFGSYASIEYWHKFSPSIVPGSLQFASYHSGMQLQAELIGTVLTAESHNTWIEITESDPITTIINNVSNVNQFFENTDFFLLIDSEADLDMVREAVRNWGAFESLGTKIDETNRLLRDIARGVPSPEQPIEGRRR